MDRFLENEKGVFDLLTRHESVGNNLLDAMNSIDSAIYSLTEILSDLDYNEHINELYEQKKKLKAILNKDFDRLALNKKFDKM